MLDLLFETSWEVCNKVGGIYAVLSTKAKTLQQRYKDNLIFIGPDLWSAENPSPSFVEGRTPLAAWLKQAQLPEGMRVRVGRWDVPGKPLAVLVTYDACDKVLFSADGFGKFGAMDAPEEWLDEARRYFIGIVGKYGAQVQALLRKAANLDIAIICAMLGIIDTMLVGRYLDKGRWK